MERKKNSLCVLLRWVGEGGRVFLLSFLYYSLFCLFFCGLGSKVVYSVISFDYEFLFVLSCFLFAFDCGALCACRVRRYDGESREKRKEGEEYEWVEELCLSGS